MRLLLGTCQRQRIAVHGIFSLCAARKAMAAPGESRNAVLLVEVLTQFIALCKSTGVSPQVLGLQYGNHPVSSVRF